MQTCKLTDSNFSAWSFFIPSPHRSPLAADVQDVEVGRNAHKPINAMPFTYNLHPISQSGRKFGHSYIYVLSMAVELGAMAIFQFETSAAAVGCVISDGHRPSADRSVSQEEGTK